MTPIFMLSTLVTLTPVATKQSVVTHYQNTYLSSDQVSQMPWEVANEVDPSTGETVADLFAAPSKGIPSLSHTWLEATRTLSFKWNGQSKTYAESAVVSWLPNAVFIAPQSTWQQGANYDLATTEAYLQAAVDAPVAEASVVANEIRVNGPAKGWARASAEHPIVDRPLLGIIPRRIAERQINDTVESYASFFDYLTYNSQLQIEAGRLPSVAVSEDAFLAVKARSEQLRSGISYSMYQGVQRLDLTAEAGTTNCHAAAGDLLAGGSSVNGTVPFYDFSTNRGRTAADIVQWIFENHGPSYSLNQAARQKYRLENESVASRLTGQKTGYACACRAAANGCRLQLASGLAWTFAEACSTACSANGSAIPYLVASCQTVAIDN